MLYDLKENSFQRTVKTRPKKSIDDEVISTAWPG
jgi:hypothetical protein